MPYYHQWLLKGRTIYMRDEGDSTVEELQRAIDQLINMIASGEAPVHVILDNRAHIRVPVSTKTLKNLVYRHPNTGWLVFITQNKMARIIVTALTTLISQPIKICGTLEEALDFLHEQDPDLPRIAPELLHVLEKHPPIEVTTG